MFRSTQWVTLQTNLWSGNFLKPVVHLMTLCLSNCAPFLVIKKSFQLVHNSWWGQSSNLWTWIRLLLWVLWPWGRTNTHRSLFGIINSSAAKYWQVITLIVSTTLNKLLLRKWCWSGSLHLFLCTFQFVHKTIWVECGKIQWKQTLLQWFNDTCPDN